jgi:hypothetical protein
MTHFTTGNATTLYITILFQQPWTITLVRAQRSDHPALAKTFFLRLFW